jgi:glutathione S-transferase
MRLIGMLDSPYVRRVAISLKVAGLPFTHEAVSVFRHFDTFASINPVVKAPTLVTDDGVVLMDSALILEHLERLSPALRKLSPDDIRQHARAQRIIGLALAACEKSVQIAYERNLRPEEKRHQPWIDRVKGQLLTAYNLLEADIGSGQTWLFGDRPLQADITTAVAWRFTQHELPGLVKPEDFPGLSAFSSRAETLPEFQSTPLG